MKPNAPPPELPPPFKSASPATAIVLGSGLGSFVDALEIEHAVDYDEIKGLPASGVPGHQGKLLLAKLENRPLLVAQGRVHLYEGWSAADVTTFVRMAAAGGVKHLILTNAAGSLNPDFPPGNWMMLNDHINLTGATPLAGGPNFVDMTEVYSLRLRRLFHSKADALGMPLHSGVYAAMPGPQYETPAEIKMLRTFGADAVGMSTVPEATQARALGMEIAAFSCLTNWGAGMVPATLSHDEVTEVGRLAASRMVELLQRALPEL